MKKLIHCFTLDVLRSRN